MDRNKFDRDFANQHKEFDENFQDIKKVVKTGFAFATVGGLIGLVIYACIAIAAIWALGRFIFHAW